MKIDELTFIPHRLKRRGRWQTASYTADYVDVFYVKIHTDDGLTGIGASSVVPNARADPFGAGLEAVKAAATGLFIGKDPLQIAPLSHCINVARGKTFRETLTALDSTNMSRKGGHPWRDFLETIRTISMP